MNIIHDTLTPRSFIHLSICGEAAPQYVVCSMAVCLSIFHSCILSWLTIKGILAKTGIRPDQLASYPLPPAQTNLNLLKFISFQFCFVYFLREKNQKTSRKWQKAKLVSAANIIGEQVKCQNDSRMRRTRVSELLEVFEFRLNARLTH